MICLLQTALQTAFWAWGDVLTIFHNFSEIWDPRVT